MKRLVSYQPQYFPRLHYFARILAADIFAVADYVQFVRKHAYHMSDGSSPIGPSYQAHTPIKTASGVLLVDIPTRHDGRQGIHETQLAFPKPKERLKNFRIIAQHYRTAPQFAAVAPPLEAFFQREHASVAEINMDSIRFALALILEIPAASGLDDVHAALMKSGFRLRKIDLASHSGVAPSDKESGRDANDWLVDTCQHHGADEYYFGGTGAAAYMDFSKFEDAGISLVQQEWRGREYPQLHGAFVPNLSIIDLLMNVLPAEAREILFTKPRS